MSTGSNREPAGAAQPQPGSAAVDSHHFQYVGPYRLEKTLGKGQTDSVSFSSSRVSGFPQRTTSRGKRAGNWESKQRDTLVDGGDRMKKELRGFPTTIMPSS
ncbi:hypothetical protein MRX96_013029 [Rhipicephalus microplus]